MNANLAALAYLASGVLFILALRGLSSPVTSRRGNLLGMSGMALAVAVTLVTLWSQQGLDGLTLALIAGGVAIGGGTGALIARRVHMTAMPQLVAAFHSLVGLSACFVATAALYAPAAYGIAEGAHVRAGEPHRALDRHGGRRGDLHRLADRLRQAERQHDAARRSFCRRATSSTSRSPPPSSALLVVLVMSGGDAKLAFWGAVVLATVLGVTLIIPIGGADMPVVISMLNSYSGWAAAALGFTLANTTLIITGALVGSSGAILSLHHVQGDEPLASSR